MTIEYSVSQILFFSAIVLLALIIDLFSHRSDKPVSFRNALFWSAFWIVLSLLFSLYIFKTHGKVDALAYLSGYLLEKSLSMDNLFVFMAIFASFGIKDEDQHRVLYYGIIFAIVSRLVFIAMGTTLFDKFGRWAMLLFSIFILLSAFKMWKAKNKTLGSSSDYKNNRVIKFVGRFFPITSDLYGHKFFIKKNGKNYATPLFICLLIIEVADIMFAFDSIPAIIAITRKPFLVYSSNIFAILGLRSLYFLLATAKKHLQHLEKAIIIVLVFIGIKMFLEVLNLHFITPTFSLIVITAVILLGILGSIIFPSKTTE